MGKHNNTIPCPFCSEDIDVSTQKCVFCGEVLSRAKLRHCPYCTELIPRETNDVCPLCNAPLNETTPADGGKTAATVRVLKKIRYPIVTVLLIFICSITYCNTFWRSYKEVWQPQLMAAAEAERKQGGSGFSVLAQNKIDFFPHLRVPHNF